MSAFSSYQHPTTLESCPAINSVRSGVSPVIAVTAGASLLHDTCNQSRRSDGARTTSPSVPTSITLPDGRLHAGTHLPLLARRYRYLGKLGEGVSAQALLAEDTLRPGHLVTIKCFKRQHRVLALREARTLRYLHSSQSSTKAPGIVRLLGTFSLGGHVCLVLERLHPRFLDWIADLTTLTTSDALNALRKVGYQLLTSVTAMHAAGVVHADIKPDNILMQRPSNSSGIGSSGHNVGISLVDLGGAFSPTETDMSAIAIEVQTLPYRAPEVALGCPCDAAIDCWSVGVVLAEAALARPLFPASTPLELLQHMVVQLGPLPQTMVSGAALGRQVDLSQLTMPPPTSLVEDKDGGLPQATLAAIFGDCNIELQIASKTMNKLGIVHRELQRFDPCFADLVASLLQYNPGRRPFACQALLHDFFRDLHPALDLILLTNEIEKQNTHQVASLRHEEPARVAADEGAERQASAAKGAAAEDERPPKHLPTKGITTDRAHDSSIEGGTAVKLEAVHDADEPAASEVGEAAGGKVSAGQGKSSKKSRSREQQNEDKKRDKNADASEDDDAAKRSRRDRGSKPWWMV